MRFADKVALISAAGAGIGRATAEIIAREGGIVVAIDVQQNALDRLTAEIGGRALGIRADALDAASVDAAVRRAVDAHGRIDILVNAVGGSIGPERAPAVRSSDAGAGRYPPARSSARAMQANATFAVVGTPKRAVWRAGKPLGKCVTYSALISA